MSAFSQLASKMTRAGGAKTSTPPPNPHLPPTPMGRVGGDTTSKEKYGIGSAVTSTKPAKGMNAPKGPRFPK